MNSFKVDQFVTEFPWLEELFKAFSFVNSKFLEIIVRRIDENLLHRVLVFDHWYSPGTDDPRYERLFAVSYEGSVSEVPVQTSGTHQPPFCYQDWGSWEGRPVIEALTGFEDAQCLVLVSVDWDHGQEFPRMVEIYKPAKRFSLRGEIIRERIRQNARVREASKI